MQTPPPSKMSNFFAYMHKQKKNVDKKNFVEKHLDTFFFFRQHFFMLRVICNVCKNVFIKIGAIKYNFHLPSNPLFVVFWNKNRIWPHFRVAKEHSVFVSLHIFLWEFLMRFSISYAICHICKKTLPQDAGMQEDSVVLNIFCSI